ncbi:MAG: hypothetical protein ABFC63_09380 [Thermoguttaceae bacterium]
MFRITTIFLAALLTFACATHGATPFRLSLEDATVGKLPSGWKAEKTGEGPGSAWAVAEDATAPGGRALAQTSAEGVKRLFNLCVASEPSFRNLDVSVAFKAVAGKIDQGGGLVWRYHDANNYYVARMNPLEDNFCLDKVVDGKRKRLASVDVKAVAGRWHVLRVVHSGDHIECYLSGKRRLDVKDDTFSAAGKIGLWTKADAQTHFAALRAEEK